MTKIDRNRTLHQRGPAEGESFPKKTHQSAHQPAHALDNITHWEPKIQQCKAATSHKHCALQLVTETITKQV